MGHYIETAGHYYGWAPDHLDVAREYDICVESLAQLFHLDRRQKAELASCGYLDLDPDQDGASYCEITACSCNDPLGHLEEVNGYQRATWRRYGYYLAREAGEEDGHRPDVAHVRPQITASDNLRGADLKGANLEGADLLGADLEGADLRGANLKGADLGGAGLVETDLRMASLAEANLWRANLADAELVDGDLTHSNLEGANLRGANLRRAGLEGANLHGANLRGADLRGADLRGANLKGADLRGADLRGANLGGANLAGADLKGADLKGADLEGANLADANLADANLGRADLSGVRGLLDPAEYMAATFERDAQGRGYIAYKAFGLHYPQPSHWVIEPGSVISEVVNPDRATGCGSGVNVGTRAWVASDYAQSIWRVLIRWEWLPGVVVPFDSGGKVRCSKVELLEEVVLSEGERS